MRRLGALVLLATTACAGGASTPAPSTPAEPPPTPESPAPAAAAPPEPPTAGTSRGLFAVEGTVTYLQRIALTPEAVVRVELRDAAIAPGEGPAVGKAELQHPGQVPIAFTVWYLSSDLLAGHRYVLSARIVDRGQVQFVTEKPVPAFPHDAGAPLEIVVVPVK